MAAVVVCVWLGGVVVVVVCRGLGVPVNARLRFTGKPGYLLPSRSKCKTLMLRLGNCTKKRPLEL